MIIKQVRVSQQAKDQLSRLKAKTGIKNWQKIRKKKEYDGQISLI